MKRVVTATEARIRFGELIRRVAENRESVIVERGGKPQAVVLSVSEYERLLKGQQQDQNEWKALVDSARDQIRTLDKARLVKFIGTLNEDQIEQVNKAARIHLALL
jgi:prevent-host-death family protein